MPTPAAYIRRLIDRIRFRVVRWRESRAFYKAHGPIVRIEPNTPESRRKP